MLIIILSQQKRYFLYNYHQIKSCDIQNQQYICHENKSFSSKCNGKERFTQKLLLQKKLYMIIKYYRCRQNKHNSSKCHGDKSFQCNYYQDQVAVLKISSINVIKTNAIHSYVTAKKSFFCRNIIRIKVVVLKIGSVDVIRAHGIHSNIIAKMFNF